MLINEPPCPLVKVGECRAQLKEYDAPTLQRTFAPHLDVQKFNLTGLRVVG